MRVLVGTVVGMIERLGVAVGEASHRGDRRLHVEQHALDVGMIDDRRLGAGRRTDGATLGALMGVAERLLVGRSAMPTPSTPTPRRALFIIVNMQRMP